MFFFSFLFFCDLKSELILVFSIQPSLYDIYWYFEISDIHFEKNVYFEVKVFKSVSFMKVLIETIYFVLWSFSYFLLVMVSCLIMTDRGHVETGKFIHVDLVSCVFFCVFFYMCQK